MASRIFWIVLGCLVSDGSDSIRQPPVFLDPFGSFIGVRSAFSFAGRGPRTSAHAGKPVSRLVCFSFPVGCRRAPFFAGRSRTPFSVWRRVPFSAGRCRVPFLVGHRRVPFPAGRCGRAPFSVGCISTGCGRAAVLPSPLGAAEFPSPLGVLPPWGSAGFPLPLGSAVSPFPLGSATLPSPRVPFSAGCRRVPFSAGCRRVPCYAG